MKKALSIFILLTSICISNAQNLVPNGSFEQYYSCPNNTSQVDTCIGWYKVLNSPDYFSACSFYPISIPDNFCGYQFPFDGQSYMGLYTYVWVELYREIIGTKLIDTLIPGNKYSISMRVSRGNWTNQAYNCSASNKLGMRFTTYAYTSANLPAINNYAQVYSDSIIEDTINWVLLSWNYISDSAYTHVYIGNFFDDAHADTTIIAAPIGQFGQAYYFIDSVNILCTSQECSVGITEVNKNEYDVIYNDGKIYLKGLKEKQFQFELYNETGQQVMDRLVNGNESIDISERPNGFYIAVLKLSNKTVIKKLIKY
jgi:OOP family OmpA-OmpF porin